MNLILVPIDASDASEKVVTEAARLAGLTGASVSLLHVVEPVASYIPVGASMDVITAEPQIPDEALTESAKSRLEEIAEPLRKRGLKIDCLALTGLAVDEIVEQATSLKTDYIVMGSHGHGAIFHLFSGSVVTGVLKHSPCPVVVVPVRHPAK